MAVGAGVLAIASVLATKANKKFLEVDDGYFSLTAGLISGPSNAHLSLDPTGNHFTNNNSGNGAKTLYVGLYTVTNKVMIAAVPLRTVSGTQVYYK